MAEDSEVEVAQISELLLQRELPGIPAFNLAQWEIRFVVQGQCDLGMFAMQLVQPVLTSTILKTGTAASSSLYF